MSMLNNLLNKLDNFFFFSSGSFLHTHIEEEMEPVVIKAFQHCHS